MAKLSSIEKNNSRRKKVARFARRRSDLKNIVMDRTNKTAEERFEAVLKLAALPRNGAKNRIRNRCALSGRPRAYYRKFNMSRIALRELAAQGMIPGLTKASW